MKVNGGGGMCQGHHTEISKPAIESACYIDRGGSDPREYLVAICRLETLKYFLRAC